MKDDNSVRGAIKEFWTAALFIVLAFAVAVLFTYLTESINWQRKQRLLELKAEQKRLEIKAKKESLVRVYTWQNIWPPANDSGVPDREQLRVLATLKPGEEYQVSQLQRYDMRDDRDIGPDDTPKQFDRVLPDENDRIYSDDLYYHDPVITFVSNKFLYIRSSLDGGNGWMEAGPTERGLKTETLKYIPAPNPESNAKREYRGTGAISVHVPLNGTEIISYDQSSTEISSEMRPYNFTYSEKLGDIYEGVPEEYAERERSIAVSQIIVEVWSRDPRIEDKNRPSKPEATYRVILRNYGSWNVTAEEYEQMKFSVNQFSSFGFRTFSPRATVELVIE